MRRVAAGVSGKLYCGAYIAAELGAWTWNSPDDEVMEGKLWQITAAVKRRDDYFFNYGGNYRLSLDFGKSIWTWADVTFTGEDDLTVRGEGQPQMRQG